jgi:hypothetical protein
VQEAVLQNLIIVGSSFGLYALCVIANILIKTYRNVAELKEAFSIQKLFMGIIKMFSVGGSSAVAAVVISMIPYVPNLGDMFTTPEIKEVISSVAIIGVYANAIISNLIKAITEINNVLNGTGTSPNSDVKISEK